MNAIRKNCDARGPCNGAAAVLATLAAVLVALAGCSRVGHGNSRPVIVHGTLETDDARLSFKVPGRLVARAVDEGRRVEAGALIARLDDTEFVQELAVRQAEADVAAAALAELEAGTRPQEIAAAEATLGSAEAERRRAQLEYARQESLRASNVVATREFESAEASLRVAEARVG